MSSGDLNAVLDLLKFQRCRLESLFGEDLLIETLTLVGLSSAKWKSELAALNKTFSFYSVEQIQR
jgi:hypothetical protein